MRFTNVRVQVLSFIASGSIRHLPWYRPAPTMDVPTPFPTEIKTQNKNTTLFLFSVSQAVTIFASDFQKESNMRDIHAHPALPGSYPAPEAQHRTRPHYSPGFNTSSFPLRDSAFTEISSASLAHADTEEPDPPCPNTILPTGLRPFLLGQNLERRRDLLQQELATQLNQSRNAVMKLNEENRFLKEKLRERGRRAERKVERNLCGFTDQKCDTGDVLCRTTRRPTSPFSSTSPSTISHENDILSCIMRSVSNEDVFFWCLAILMSLNVYTIYVVPAACGCSIKSGIQDFFVFAFTVLAVIPVVFCTRAGLGESEPIERKEQEEITVKSEKGEEAGMVYGTCC